jgi:hypothetical protein
MGRKLGIAIAKLTVGTVLYLAIILIARFYPRAAGMMLTFPTLNGLTLALASAPGDAAKSARTMLLLPVLNGVLCAFYIFSFWLFWHGDFSANLLFAAVIIIWAVVAVPVARYNRGLPEQWQLVYALGCTVAFVALALLVLTFEPGRVSAVANDDWFHFLVRNWWRVGLFFCCLGLVIYVQASFPQAHGLIGMLGGFPVIPFFGVWTLASDQGKSIGERIDAFSNMGGSVWLGPAIGFWFIYFFSRYLNARPSLYDHDWKWITRILASGVGWVLCGIAIGVLTYVMNRVY